MTTKLASHLEQTYKASGHGLSAFAERAGYRNVSKFIRRWWRFVDHDDAHPFFIIAVAKALGLDRESLRRFIERDRGLHMAVWELDKSRPFEPTITVCAFMALLHKEVLPPEMTLPQAEQYAHQLALSFRRFVYLAWTRVFSVKFDGTGRLVYRSWANPEDTMPLWMRKAGLRQICGDTV